MKAADNLMGSQDFDFDLDDEEDNFQENGGALPEDSTIPRFSKFESNNVSYKQNLDSMRFKEPRMFTMKQIRNIMFACLNQSTIMNRLKLSEERHRYSYRRGIELEQVDRKIEAQSKQFNDELNKALLEHKTLFNETQALNSQ